MNLEINISCPNLDKKLIDSNLNRFINKERDYCIIKMSPHSDRSDIKKYYEQGFRQFHFSNTLKTKNGGLSGAHLRMYTNMLTLICKTDYPDTTVIAGGGIREIKDIEDYRDYGADYFSISTILFNPFMFSIFYYNYRKWLKKFD